MENDHVLHQSDEICVHDHSSEERTPASGDGPHGPIFMHTKKHTAD